MQEDSDSAELPEFDPAELPSYLRQKAAEEASYRREEAAEDRLVRSMEVSSASPAASKPPAISIVTPVIRYGEEGKNFLGAIAALIERGEALTKGEWGNTDIYVVLRNDHFQLHKPGGVWHDWIITRADTLGEDWFVLQM